MAQATILNIGKSNTALRSWLNRYQAALVHAGYGVKVVEQIADAMEAVQALQKAEAA